MTDTMTAPTATTDTLTAEATTGPASPMTITHVESKWFIDVLNRVKFAAATVDTRPVLNGVYLDGEVAVASDGFRLVAHDLSLPGIKAIIPLEDVKRLVKLPKLGHITLTTNYPESASTLAVKHDQMPGWSETIRLIDGTWPNYRQIIPTTWAQSFTVDSAAELRQACKYISNPSKAFKSLDPFKPVEIMEYNPEIVALSYVPGSLVVGGGTNHNSTLSVPAHHEQSDAAYSMMGASTLRWGCNPKYIDQILGCIPKGGDVTFKVTSNTGPGVFTSTGLPGWLAVLMPMYIKDKGSK